MGIAALGFRNAGRLALRKVPGNQERGSETGDDLTLRHAKAEGILRAG